MKTLIRPAAEVPVAREVDVCVAGAGLSGVFAALGAARRGACVLVVDRMSAPGGNIGPGMIGGYGIGRWVRSTLHDGAFPGVIGEFFERFNREIADQPWVYATMSHTASRLATAMFEEAGVELALSAYASDPVMEDSLIRGLFVEGKSGTIAVLSNVVIDATGDADIAARAGAPVRRGATVAEMGWPDSGHMQGDASIPRWNDGQVYFYVAEADFFKYAHFRTKPFELSEADRRWARENLRIPWKGWPDSMIPILREGWESGEFQVERELRPNLRVALNDWFSESMARPGLIGGRAGIFGDYDTGDWRDVALMESAVRSMVIDGINFFRRKQVPGFENAYPLCMSPFLGARGGPCIEGEFVLTDEHLKNGLRVPDALYWTCAGAGKYGNKAGYEMPYRIMLPKNVDGLLVTGRGASYLRRGHDPGTRERSNMMALGQAAGVAAALCAELGVPPRALDVKRLQRALIEAGYHIGDEARLVELGLRDVDAASPET